jgi:glycosyl transferase family 25
LGGSQEIVSDSCVAIDAMPRSWKVAFAQVVAVVCCLMLMLFELPRPLLRVIPLGMAAHRLVKDRAVSISANALDHEGEQINLVSAAPLAKSDPVRIISINTNGSASFDSLNVSAPGEMRDMFKAVDKVVYINLDSRKDRRAEIERELLRAFPAAKIQRFPAIRVDDWPVVPPRRIVPRVTHTLISRRKGHIGCTKSHIAVLEKALAEGWANVLIVEDDLEWTNYEAGAQRFNFLLKAPYDVIVLGGSHAHYHNGTGRLQSSQTTTGYIVAAHYYATLLTNLKEGLRNLEAGALGINPAVDSVNQKFAIDQYWKRLQERDNWYIVQPPFVRQRPSFSSIFQKVVNYTDHFSHQVVLAVRARN